MAKKNYLCVQRSVPGNCDKPSQDQMQAMLAQFQAWMEKFKSNIVDMGGKLGDGKVVTSTRTTDGPFAESKEVVGGYMIVTADDLQAALEVVRQSPGVVMPGSSVEVREICVN